MMMERDKRLTGHRRGQRVRVSPHSTSHQTDFDLTYVRTVGPYRPRGVRNQ